MSSLTLRLLSHTNASDSGISPELPTQGQRPAGPSTAYVHSQKTITEITGELKKKKNQPSFLGLGI